MNRIRNQRQLLKILRDKKIITTTIYQELYAKSKGGFFRSRRHITLYLEEHELTPHETQKQAQPATKMKKGTAN